MIGRLSGGHTEGQAAKAREGGYSRELLPALLRDKLEDCGFKLWVGNEQ